MDNYSLYLITLNVVMLYFALIRVTQCHVFAYDPKVTYMRSNILQLHSVHLKHIKVKLRNSRQHNGCFMKNVSLTIFYVISQRRNDIRPLKNKNLMNKIHPHSVEYTNICYYSPPWSGMPSISWGQLLADFG